MKIGPGPKNKITVHNTIIEEVPKYKYLDKVYITQKETSRNTSRKQRINYNNHAESIIRHRWQEIQGNENESDMAMYRSNNHPNTGI